MSRRTMVHGAAATAWAVLAVTMMTAAPAYAASAELEVTASGHYLDLSQGRWDSSQVEFTLPIANRGSAPAPFTNHTRRHRRSRLDKRHKSTPPDRHPDWVEVQEATSADDSEGGDVDCWVWRFDTRVGFPPENPDPVTPNEPGPASADYTGTLGGTRQSLTQREAVLGSLGEKWLRRPRESL